MVGIIQARRAQIASSEFIMAYFIFSLVLISALFLWDTTTKNILKSEHLHKMNSLGTDAVEKLLRTSGFPGDWIVKPVDNISALGLVNESRILDRGKVLRFVELMDSSKFNECGVAVSNYNCSRYLLGVEKYEFYFTLKDVNGSIMTIEGQNCSTGNFPVDADYIISVRRSAILDDEIVMISLVMWS